MIENKLLSVDNGTDPIVDVDATTVAKEYYTSYSKYVLEYRALPSVFDGLKPVQRRIIYTANQYPLKLMKTAKLSGAVLAYHPHGSASITGAINEMAHPLNALPLFTTKGNFGGVGFGASADRYTECFLSEIARKNFCQFIEYAEYETGEIGELEPVSLPTLVPYALFKGSEGIGVGLSTKIMPLNLLDLVDYYIDYIKHDGQSSKLVKPDIGYVLLDMDLNEVKDAVTSYKGRITASSVVTQISDTSFLVEGLFEKTIDAVINKIDKWSSWFSKEQVGFRDASTSSMKYVFEIYDNTISPTELKEALVWATQRSGTFTRVVEENGTAVYAPFEYVVRKSLEYLNSAIDRKIQSELKRSEQQLTLYTVLALCKSAGVFDNITSMTSDQLVDLIVRTAECSQDIAWDIVKKPISYLTKSHDKEQENLMHMIQDLKNHDRKKYLLSLYKDFRRSIIPIYENKKHTLTKDMVMTNPCIKYNAPDDIQILDNDGLPFDSTVYFISDKGYIYKRSISTTASSALIVETIDNDKIIGVVTDKSSYIEVVTNFKYPGWEGRSIIPVENISYDKRFIDLRSEDDESIVSVEGISKVAKKYNSSVKGSRVAKTTFYKIK